MPDRAETGAAALALLRGLASGGVRRIGELAEELGWSRRQVSKAAGKLAIRHWITRAAAGAGCYQATPAGLKALAEGATITAGPVGPNRKVNTHADTLRGRAWLAMRVRRRFTLGEIVTDACLSGEGTIQDRDNLARYIARLKDAGYLVELAQRQAGTALTSNGFKVFVLRRNTGRQPPIYRHRDRLIHDPNTGEDVPCARP